MLVAVARESTEVKLGTHLTPNSRPPSRAVLTLLRNLLVDQVSSSESDKVARNLDLLLVLVLYALSSGLDGSGEGRRDPDGREEDGEGRVNGRGVG